MKKQPTTNEELNSFALEMHKQGFEIIVPKKPATYLSAFKNGAFIYIQAEGNYRFNGYFSFSTVHKPSKENGTGLRAVSDADLTIENLNKAVNMSKRGLNFKNQPVVKYISLNDYFNSDINNILGNHIFDFGLQYVTKKPDPKQYIIYDFARSAQQAKDMLVSLSEGQPIAHKSKSQGGLYNIYVKMGTPLHPQKF